MKILIVNDYGILAGGAERVSLILRDGLRARGHDARLFTSSARPVAGANPADYVCFGSESVLRRGLQAVNPWAALALSRVLLRFQPDVVHVRMFLTQLSPLILPALRDFPSLLHLVNYQAVCPLNIKVLPDGTACRFTAGRACWQAGCVSLLGLARTSLQLGLWKRWQQVFDRVVANSAALGRRLREEGLQVDEVIWNGTPVRPARPPVPDRPTVAFAGRLVWKKGVDVLLRATAVLKEQLPHCQLLIAGDGPERPAIERLVTELGLSRHVVLLGHLPPQELEHRLAPAWVVVVPSRYDEPFANVALEAMMRGSAVVASAAGGSTEIVRDGQTGLLVPPADADALARALSRLLTDRVLAERMGAAGRSVALAEFTEDRMVERFLATYRNMPGRPRPTAGQVSSAS